MRIIFSVVIIAFFNLTSTSAQEQLGLRLENYAGVSSLTLNPAGNLSNPLKWDINLVGGGLFFENNYFFVEQTNSFELWRNRDNATFVLAKDLEGAPGPNTFIVDFYDDDRKRFANFSGFLAGPSVTVKINDQHAFGIFTNARTVWSSQDVPNEFSYYKYDTRAFFDGFQAKPFSGVVMGWSEIGLNYALKIPTSDGFFGFGANLRFLQGYEAAYLESITTYEHTKLPDNSISIGQPDSRFGYTSSNLQGESFRLKKNGGGLALDIGAVMALGEGEAGYKMKLGASLLDLGYLKFSKNAHAHRVTSPDVSSFSWSDYENFTEPEDIDDLIRLFSLQTLGDSLASEEGNSFRLAMPAALSLQGDYAFTENVFLNATLMQRLPTGKVAARRGNLLALTPRFEHRWFSASLPLALYNWQDFRVGLAARLGFLVIGSDNLLSLTGQRDWTGADFYIALKLNPFNLGLGGGDGGSGKRRYGGKGKVRCYDF